MPKWVIKIRAKYWLPRKWAVHRCVKAEDICYPPRIEVIEKQEELLKAIPVSQRNKDLKLEHNLKGQLELIEWILAYGSTEG